MELTQAAPFKTFCDVGHDRNRGRLNLTGQPKVFRELARAGDLINSPCQLAGFLPRNQIFKLGDAVFHPKTSALRTHYSGLLKSTPWLNARVGLGRQWLAIKQRLWNVVLLGRRF